MPTDVILFPGEATAVFECVIDPSIVVISWQVDGIRYGLDELFDGDLPGHNATGTNITVSIPVNGTSYVCVVPRTPPNPTIISDPAFLYIAGKLHNFTVYVNHNMFIEKFISTSSSVIFEGQSFHERSCYEWSFLCLVLFFAHPCMSLCFIITCFILLVIVSYMSVVA